MTKFTQPSREVEVSSRYRFQFSNPAAQRAEALLNAREAQKLVARHVRTQRQEGGQNTTTAAGECFRRVMFLLGKGVYTRQP